jgi:hypothetical protein
VATTGNRQIGVVRQRDDRRPDRGRDGVQLGADLHQCGVSRAVMSRSTPPPTAVGVTPSSTALQRPEVEAQGLQRPGDAEQPQSRGVEHQHRDAEPPEHRMGEERDDGCGQRMTR